MIAYIKGKVIEVNEESVVIENNGVGYRIYCCQTILSSFNTGNVSELFIRPSFSMYDGFKLYGFLDKRQMDIFELLLNSIPNTGSKKAIEYLDKILKSPQDFKKAILSADIKLLKNLFGFTPKTCEKLVLSLKNKMENFNTDEKERYITNIFSSNYELVINALVSLGYKTTDAREALNMVIEDKKDKNLSVEELIKLSLKNLSSTK